MLNARTVKDWLLKEPLLMHDPNISLLDACQVLTFIQLRVGNDLACAPAWSAKSREELKSEEARGTQAEKTSGTFQSENPCKSWNVFFAYHCHYKTIIVYNNSIITYFFPQPLLSSVKYAPQKAHTCFIHQAIAKHVIACSTALASWHWKPNMQMDIHAISCKYATWFQWFQWFSPDLRIRRRLSGLTQPMSLAFGTGLVPWSKKKWSASFLFPVGMFVSHFYGDQHVSRHSSVHKARSEMIKRNSPSNSQLSFRWKILSLQRSWCSTSFLAATWLKHRMLARPIEDDTPRQIVLFSLFNDLGGLAGVRCHLTQVVGFFF